MPPNSSMFLVNKSHLKQKALTLRLPQHIHQVVNATRERADAAGFVFDIQAVVADALEKAVQRVNFELAAREGGAQAPESAYSSPEKLSRRRARKAISSEPVTQ